MDDLRSLCRSAFVKCALVATLTTSAWTPALSAAEGERAAVEVQVITLLRNLRDPAAPSPEVTGKSLALIGAASIDLLLQALEHQSVPALDEGRAQVLSRVQGEAVLIALGELGRTAVLQRVEALYATPQNTAQRRAALLAHGSVIEGSQLDVLFMLATDKATLEFDEGVSRSLQAALESVLTRDPGGFGTLNRSFRDLSPGVLNAVILAIGATGDARGLAFYAEVLEWESDFANLVAAQIPRVAPASDERLNRSVAQALIDLLDSDHDNTLNAAILALGNMEDFECVPRLIELLDSESTAAKANAHHSLCKLLNKNTRNSSGVWKQWLRDEERWFADRSHRALADLSNSNPDKVLATLDEIGVHRLARHHLAIAVCETLGHPAERVRMRACLVLSGLGSRWSVNDLILSLEDADANVRAAAGAALRAITGENRAAEPEAWEDYPRPRPDQL